MAAHMKSTINAKSKLKPSQNDLRRLMKEKLNAGKDKDKKIESPFAKYNNLGQLYCVLCNTEVKSEIVWTAHVNGRQHKQNFDAVKQQKQLAADNKNFKKPPTPPPSISKRKVEESEHEAKKRKMATTADEPLPSDFFDAGVSNREEDEEMETEVSQSSDVNLPSDFFAGDVKSTEDDKSTDVANRKEGLPEGFFDDPITDAKARNVEYKDPIEEEWEKFQKEIADATNVAQVIIEEEDEDSTKERQIDEIDEQIHNWARVEALQRRKEELAAKQRQQSSKNDDDELDDVDEHEFDGFLDWRLKGSWR